MIKLTVLHHHGAPLSSPLSAQFDELGGTIGRADTNQLVLPDPERTISRVHAQIAFRGGAYAVIDRGSNAISHNGRPLGNGQEATLRTGDQLMVGGYLIQVDGVTATGSGQVSRSDDPFADLTGLAFGGAGKGAGDPFAMGSAGPGAGTPAPRTGAPAAPAAFQGIPDDWDPFAADASAPPAPLSQTLGQSAHLGLDVAGAAPAPLIEGLGDLGGGKANTTSSLDAMFGLGPGSGGDPLANSVLAAIDVAPNMANHIDPLQSLNTVNAVSATAAPDTASALQQPFLEAPLVVPGPPPAASAASNSPVLSWDDGAQDGRTIIRPKARAGAAPAAAAPLVSASASDAGAGAGAAAPGHALDPLAGFMGAAPPPTPAPVLASTPAPPSPAQPAPAHEAALLDALREGLGLERLPFTALTPEVMRLLGQLVHESTRGAVDLLVARAALKREIRAEVTMIVAKENNPLKFSPSAEVALNHLLSPPARGFMPAGPAIRDAYDDLRAHQFAFVAGMRAALEGLLQRFDPAELEGRLTQKSMLSSLLPATRKARMWDVFTELYGQISAEASDDFHELFGKAFLVAYEAHIDQLQRDD